MVGNTVRVRVQERAAKTRGRRKREKEDRERGNEEKTEKSEEREKETNGGRKGEVEGAGYVHTARRPIAMVSERVSECGSTAARRG